MNRSKIASIGTIAFLIFLLIAPLAGGDPALEGTLKTGLSIATRDCKVEYGSIVCSEIPEEEDETPMFFESLLDMELSDIFGPGGDIRSISEIYHPYTPYSGLTFQALTSETLLGEIASMENQIVFSPNIILYTTPDKRTEWYGDTFENLAFRRYKSSLEFGLVGLTANTTLILDNWQDEPENQPDINTGLIIEISGETDEEILLEAEARIGAKEGVTCFGNCLGPLKLQEIAIQESIGFEEFLFSADNFSFCEVDLSLSGKFSSDNGFNGMTVRGTRTWDLNGSKVTLASSLSVTAVAFVPFGTSVTWSGDPFVISIFFDETYKLSNASKSLQFNPDLRDLEIDGLKFGGQALLDQQLNLNLTIPTDPVDFTAGLRFEHENKFYSLNSGILSAQLDQDSFGAKIILAFRENSKIIKIETELEF
ncbi:hypothetical protein KGY72_08750 [Candidatus Bipolaricaulota bacterium]|nr:hypothetical protein [Candidatus Bipolaricaulota bacterium]MBS3792843.1 hypothetical protein [Candidatus Bipolaricaulota bacterium]